MRIVGKSKSLGYLYLLCHYSFSYEKPTSILCLCIVDDSDVVFFAWFCCVCMRGRGGGRGRLIYFHYIFVDYV